MSALSWGTDLVDAGSSAPRPHLLLLPGGRGQGGTSGGLRVTRRGRLALLGLALVLATALGFAGLRTAEAGGQPRLVTVEAGQTLSEIAAAHLPDHSISAGIVAIQVANGLSTAQVNTGQHLVIPAE